MLRASTDSKPLKGTSKPISKKTVGWKLERASKSL